MATSLRIQAACPLLLKRGRLWSRLSTVAKIEAKGVLDRRFGSFAILWYQLSVSKSKALTVGIKQALFILRFELAPAPFNVTAISSNIGVKLPGITSAGIAAFL